MTSAASRLRAGWPLIRQAFTVAGLVALVLTLTGVLPFHGDRIGWGFARDFYAYWSADMTHPYSSAVGVGFAYLYSPAFLQMLLPLKVMPFELAAALWLAAGILALWWLRALWMLVIPGVSTDLLLGNVNVFIAVSIVMSMSIPATWTLPLLTKVTPGVGLLWLAFTGRWRTLALAIVSCLAVVVISYTLQPTAWSDWISVLSASMQSRGHTTAEFGPLSVRLPVSIILAVVAGRSGHLWLLPLASLVAMPVIWPATLAVLCAVPRLTDQRIARAQ